MKAQHECLFQNLPHWIEYFAALAAIWLTVCLLFLIGLLFVFARRWREMDETIGKPEL